jgi:hypothetical protein
VGFNFALVAQLVEHQFCKLVVVGSIPSEGSILVSTRKRRPAVIRAVIEVAPHLNK